MVAFRAESPVGADRARIDRITPEDEVVLWPDALWPQENCALLILEATPDLAVVRNLVGAQLHVEPRLRRRLVVPPRRLGAPVWVDDQEFRIHRHVRELAVDAPGSDAELLARVEEVRRVRLDHTHPLWELTLLTGLAQGRAAILLRSHHVLADGVTTVALFGRILTATLPDVVPQDWTPAPAPTDEALYADERARRSERRRTAWARMLRPIALARSAVSWLGSSLALFARVERHTTASLNRTVGPDRTFAVLETDLARVAAAGHSCGGTVNDVLLAMVGGGLRRLLLHGGTAVDDLEIDVFVPVSLRSGADGRANLISEFPVAVPVGESDARARLHLVADRTRTLKSRPHPSLGILLGSRLVRWAFRRFVVADRHPVNVTSSDLRGPAQPLEVAGVRVLAIHPFLALIANVTVAVGAVSYAGGFFIGIVADRETVGDLDDFVAGMRAELQALSDTSGTASARSAGLQ